MTQLSRRSLIGSLISFVAAPAIVRIGSLMPVTQMIEQPLTWMDGISIYENAGPMFVVMTPEQYAYLRSLFE